MAIKKELAVKTKKIKIKKPNFLKIKIIPLNRRKLIGTILSSFVLLMFVVMGTLLGAYMAVLQNLPSISSLEEFKPNIITSIYAQNGEVIGEYAQEKRIEIPYERIPDVLKKAIIATEDPRFYKHKGIDFFGILRALKEDIKLIFTPRRLQGGSTISQQLAREFFLHRRQKVRRKLKEVILALQIERSYSKEEIMTMYCNQFYLNHGAYGVEAAAQLYYGKHASELNLGEAAMITGILRGPSVYSPYNTPERTLQRRNHVVNRMIVEGLISKEEGEAVKEEPLNVLPRYRDLTEFSAYFNEEVRKHLEQNYGADTLYREGLKVYTTLDPTLQRFAEEALVKGLRTLDKRQGWRLDKKNLLEIKVENLEEITKPFRDEKTGETLLSTWLKSSLEVDEIMEAVVLSVERNETSIKLKNYTGKLTNKDVVWTGTQNLKNLIKRGDIIQVKINNIDEEKKELLVSLDQEPIVEGAFLAIEPHTGQIKAMVGGYSFKRLKFNQAIQAVRQSGSAIKPFLYCAALENGYTPASTFNDEPTEFFDKWSEEPYAPENYDRKFEGKVTLRRGLEKSRNIVTTKLLESISPQIGVDYCRKFGIASPVYPYLSLALGSFEMKLIELVSAFSTFPNKGVRIKPYFMNRIEDKEGNILEETKIESEDVISPQTAYIMTSLLQGAIRRGTGIAASWLEKPLAGKTGTTDEYTDAWFIGFSPSLCAGIWIGHKEKVTIGEKQSGAVAALPVWIDFFQKIIEEEKRLAEENEEEIVAEEFEVPPNLSFAEIDRKTGLLATPICQWAMREVFMPGTEPDRFCTYEDHMMVLDYYETLKEKAKDQ